MTKRELMAFLRMAKAERQIVELKLTNGASLIDRITKLDVDCSREAGVEMAAYYCTVNNITHVRVCKPGAWQQVEGKLV